MNRTVFWAAIAAAALAGCSSGGSWNPWAQSTGQEPPRTPPGAKGYACDGGKRLLVRYEDGGKTAWVLYPDRQVRLDRVPSGSGEQFSNGGTVLATKGDEALLEEKGNVTFARCKAEPTK